LRVMWDLQQGRQADACADLLGALALARNMSRDGMALAVLVQINAESMICSTIAENFHQFSPESLKQLAAGFNPASPRGTLAGTLPFEKKFFADWLLGRIAKFQKENPGDDAKVMAGIQELIVGVDRPPKTKKKNPPPSLWEQVNKAAGGSSHGIVQLLHDMEPLYQRLAVIMPLAPAEYADKIEAFSAEVQGSTNPFITMMFPALEKVRPREFGTVTELAMVRAAVEYKLHGEQGLKSVADPCGNGPFALERFVFEGVDRGFELKSAYEGRDFPEALIFTEKDGPPFQVNGKRVGQPPTTAAIKQ
jgi:hypothetical protein